MSRYPRQPRGRVSLNAERDRAERQRFACDEMLLGLGRWLRTAGYDTASGTAGMPDDAVIALAVAEKRMLLTCDRRLAARTRRVDVLTLPSAGLDAAALELRERLVVDWLRTAPGATACRQIRRARDPATAWAGSP